MPELEVDLGAWTPKPGLGTRLHLLPERSSAEDTPPSQKPDLLQEGRGPRMEIGLGGGPAKLER